MYHCPRKKDRESYICGSSLKKVAEALGCRFEYFLIPSTNTEDDNNFKNFSNNGELFEKLKKFAFLPKKPSKGWIYSLRLELRSIAI